MKIAIATLIRDSEKSIPKYLETLGYLKTYINLENWNLTSFCYENDSKDNTKNLLKDIADYYVSEDLGLNKFDNSPATLERCKLMCQFRNKLKDLVFNTDNYDIVIFSDIDLISWPEPRIIIDNIQSFEYNKHLGAVTSNGLSFYNGEIIYYDIWSLVIDRKIQNHKIWLASDIKSDMFVDSAFGGFAIYRGPAIQNLKYQPINLEGYPCPWHPVERIACEHCSLNLQLKMNNFDILIDKDQIVYRDT